MSNAGNKLVYIMGTGRSGSTVLGIALGNLQGVFYAGELSPWPGFRGEPRSEEPEVQELWKRVRESGPDAERYVSEGFRERLEHPGGLLRPRRFRSRELRRAHGECNAELVGAIAAETHTQFVVDSSHYPLRALHLARSSGLDLHVVYLTRDPVDVISALTSGDERKQPMSHLAANVYCIVVWLLSAFVFARMPRSRRIRIRFEDLANDPEHVIERVMRRFGIGGELPDFGHLMPGPIFHGNRVRLQSSIAIKPPTPRQIRSAGWRVITRILQAPLRLIQGYSILR